MLRKLRGRWPRHSTIAAYLALFIALGGASYAAVNLPKNSVGAKQIEANAVRTSEVKDSSLQCKDLKQKACTDTTVLNRLETIEMTCQDSQISVGPTTSFTRTCRGQEDVRASCGKGERATGGGWQQPPPNASVTGAGSSVTINEDRPDPTSGTPTGWVANVTASGFSTANSQSELQTPPNPQVSVYAVCAT